MSDRNIIVIGSGAAGLMAAFSASSENPGKRVLVYDGAEKPGKKIYITGKGRCNFTNARPADEFLNHVVTNPRFLYSAVSAWTPEDSLRFFEESGCPVKVERGGRAFPVSDHASDITKAVYGRATKAGAVFTFRMPVREICADNGRVSGVVLKSGERIPADAVILATGGMSYPSTGSTGDGYRMAEALGHRVLPQEPSLVALETAESFCADLQGLTLKNVTLTLSEEGKKKPLYTELGEMLFTHFGVSGPLVLSASAHYHRGMNARLAIDLKPGLTMEQLDERLIRDFREHAAKHFANALGGLFPARLIPVMVSLSGIPAEKHAGEIDKKSRQAFARLIKALPLTVTGTRGFAEAVITRGGVDVKEIDPATMQSKRIAGLFFAGEVIDVDALTGGYNLQIAWSTGYLAGKSAARMKGEESYGSNSD